MELTLIIATLIVIALVHQLVMSLPIAAVFKNIITIILVLAVVLWLFRLAGITLNLWSFRH